MKNYHIILTRNILILTIIFCSLLIRGQTTQSAFIHLDIKDSTGLTSVKNATVTFVNNDISFNSNRGLKVNITKYLTDTIIVNHWFLGTSKTTFTVLDSEVKEIKIILPKSCQSIPTTNICPICKSDKYVIEIVYGYPTKKAIRKEKRSKIIIGGCIVDDCAPNHHCRKDKFDF